ncbi:ADP-ribosylarginine hydrolase [Cavenderia fasciculata]|uniref:ADP-ribosylhydrolase ARH1 n=1 Tax=Cavenderia fasciculata TaxID=261658 RepID=F4PPQ2_CACFS|nr:ADP-ribosylarginine hydrolase [Cavenderia fasciculata]EGG22365.1 ADP-ribosylarginine hydrolase [Cavenderia fasciculata]|eukprot:XP_004360216.1 ADP-ribosylarginine hydrolase [Cavenderia fasciculata]
MEERYSATMILSAVGDAIGYKNGIWEFERNPNAIYKQYCDIGMVDGIKVNPREWRVSDDTIMHIATAVAISRPTKKPLQGDELFNRNCEKIAKKYIKCMETMAGRAPGRQTIMSVSLMTPGMRKTKLNWNEIPYAPSGGGCGGSMRSMCIGLKYYSPEAEDELIRYAIESGRITHNHPVGFLGALVSSLFTAYAIRGIPAREWGTRFYDQVLPKAKEYLTNSQSQPNRTMAQYEKGINYFENAWKSYLELRSIPLKVESIGSDYPKFPAKYENIERDNFYHSISFDGWGGSSGHDSVLIAYDALLGSGNNWKEMIERSAIHGGDSDSTAAIGCAWWGAIHGFEGVPDQNTKSIEFGRELFNLAKEIYNLRK